MEKMKEIGIIRHLDDLGRVVIPKEIRTRYGLEEGTPIEIFTKGNEIILKKANTTICQKCGQLIDAEDKFCRNCGKEQ